GTGEHITRFLGEVTGEICSILQPKGLVLTGGDTAIKAADSMKISGALIKDEVLPGIPCIYFISNKFRDIPVVTKAGAFGDKDSLMKIIEYLKKKKD
ncbi:unnamed protein product, partial [marine sediment metagenome]